MSDAATVDAPASPPVPEGSNIIPPAVRRAAARANELIKQQEEAASSEHGEPAPEPGEAQASPQGSGAGSSASDTTGAAAPGQRLAVPEGSGETRFARTDPGRSEPAETGWEQRYRTLQGKYDSEVPRLNAELNQLRHTVGQMQQHIQAREAQPAPAAPRQEAASPAQAPADIVEEYGEDFVNVMRRMARLEVEPAINSEVQSLRQEVDRLRGGQQRVEQMTGRQQIEAGLSSDPDIGNTWRQVDADQSFINWLHEYDPFAGQARINLFGDALSRGDVQRTALFYKTFLREHTNHNQAPQEARPQTPARPVAGPGMTLDSLAAPGRASRSTPANGAAEQRLWTPDAISRFYDDRRRGRFAGREAEAARIEQDIVASGLDGRFQR